MKDVAIVSYCRTGIAKATRGALNQTHGIAMAAHVMKEAVARAKIEAGEVEDACGCGRRRRDRAQRCAQCGAFAGFWRAGHHCEPLLRSGLRGVVCCECGCARRDCGIAGGVESISLVQFNLNFNGFSTNRCSK